MNQRVLGIAAFVIALSMSGCAEWTHLTTSHRVPNYSNDHSIVVDAERRLTTAGSMIESTSSGSTTQTKIHTTSSTKVI